ncbi:MAG: epoxide hydrolase [Sphingomonadaceae bacterium]|nr:epoxide hydrolase [Sphingomonadaceae bacterium]
MAFEPRPFAVEISQDALDDLNARLDLVRWPEKETVDGWQQGVPLAEAKRVVDYWRNSYDWRRCEAHLNSYDQFHAEIDGLDIHFLHIRSPHDDALPMIMTHGWPGSVIEFLNVIEPLTNPSAHGGTASQAFHLVIPSLPGYGFSSRPAQTGWTVQRTAQAWDTLMRGLGYDRYVAQGGDWGSAVTSAMALQKPGGLAAIHLNMLVAGPAPEQLENPTDEEKAILEQMKLWSAQERGYSEEQSTKPQTLGYSLVDSPVGQAMWIYEKFKGWTDCNGSPADCFSLDHVLDNIMVYWLTGTGASSARLYWESLQKWPRGKTDVPLAYSDFPKEIVRGSRRWAASSFENIIHWGELENGGHFAAFEQPELFVSELRKAFTSLR